MLKALVQLFAEKFLQSKSDWVSNQSNPKQTSIRITPISTGDWYYLVVPCNGWFCAKGITSKLLVSNGDLWQGVFNEQADFRGFSLPVSKGQTVSYQFANNPQEAYVLFIPSQGSS